eukprot:TRINITY_DN2595_c0_g1_i1.p1 TRINITY_DN2595_c0_g1~~TRINITY_DN2595_c0_g1_i1.p1  ORF type:complete len:208 (-),score=16.86 TRINITY_DN2595_c0_g1_i1:254-877(-)
MYDIKQKCSNTLPPSQSCLSQPPSQEARCINNTWVINLSEYTQNNNTQNNVTLNYLTLNGTILNIILSNSTVEFNGMYFKNSTLNVYGGCVILNGNLTVEVTNEKASSSVNLTILNGQCISGEFNYINTQGLSECKRSDDTQQLKSDNTFVVILKISDVCDDKFPIWAIVVIIVGGLLILTLLVIFAVPQLRVILMPHLSIEEEERQ